MTTWQELVSRQGGVPLWQYPIRYEEEDSIIIEGIYIII